MQIKRIDFSSARQEKRKGLLRGSFLLFLLIVTLFLLSGSAVHVKNGISLCLRTVIPSLFPFLVVSAFITVTGVGRDMGALFEKPFRFLFGTSSGSACAVFLGLVCGYPIGASAAAEAYDAGQISKRELEFLLTFINIPSAAFIICGVGENLLSSVQMGIAVFASVLSSALFVGILGRFFFMRGTFTQKRSVSSFSRPFAASLPDAIRLAAKNMMSICACVITFSALSGTVCSLEPLASAPQWIVAIVTGISEVSSGVREAAAVHGSAAPFLCAAISSWSGLSVHMQIISVCRGRGVSFLPFFISKLIQAFLSPCFLYLFCTLAKLQL